MRLTFARGGAGEASGAARKPRVRVTRSPDVRQGVFHPTRFASLQGTLLPLTPQDSLVVYRARARRRVPTPPPTLQLLLFEVVPTA
jgi:hypothetical protein